MEANINPPARTQTSPLPVSPSAAASQPQLVRALTLWQSTAIVIGIMIGSAIFIVPAEITRETGGEGAALAVWVVAGALSLFGALSFAELAAMLPQAGGQYVYLREAYGPLVSFLCGWVFFLAVQSGSISAVAVGFSQYLADFLPLTPLEQKLAASGAIVLLTAVNYRGVQEGGAVQSILTGLKVGAMVTLVALGYILVKGPPAESAPVSRLATATGAAGYLASFGVAMVAALWAYDGWNNVTFAAGEVKRPERNLPLALIFGTAAVVLIYLGLNLVYYHVLALNEIAGSPRVAADAAVRIFGHAGSHLVTLAIIIAMFGSVNGMVLAGARIYYAMAQDGLFFRWCGAVHPRFRTPHLSLLFQAAWAILLVGVGRYDQLFTYVIFAAWVFYALTALAVVILRRTRPDLPRPYRVHGYPWVPVIFVLAAALFIANTLAQKPLEAGVGCLIVALGIPVYFIWRRKPRAASD
ncbi:MAG TPA: amino acid permease [Terriglobia bacterium]|nr:amino acid permease [Terriglobia bacterium]